ncbi:hypothetical protein Hanom_Chr03g00232351 [Helianthus anomalus]
MKTRFFIIKLVLFHGFSRKTGRVSFVFWTPPTTQVVVILSKFNRESIINICNFRKNDEI